MKDSNPKPETTLSARDLLGDAITEFERTHLNQHGQIDLSDEDDRAVYLAMVQLLFGHDEVVND